MKHLQKDVISPYSLKGRLCNTVVTRPCFEHRFIPFEVDVDNGQAYAKYQDSHRNRVIAIHPDRRVLIREAKRFITAKVNQYLNIK